MLKNIPFKKAFKGLSVFCCGFALLAFAESIFLQPILEKEKVTITNTVISLILIGIAIPVLVKFLKIFEE